MEITFSVFGFVKQVVQVSDKIKPETLQKLLNSGKVLTSMREGGAISFAKNRKWVGTVNNVDNECEYSEFEVREISGN